MTTEGGSVIRVVDMLPGKQSPMHRTNSIDYGIVLEGEIELELDSGAKRTVRQGRVIVSAGPTTCGATPATRFAGLPSF